MANSNRKDLLKAVLLPSPGLDAAIEHVANGSTIPPASVPPDLLGKVTLANKVADLMGDDAFLVKEIVSHPQVQTLRDVAYHFDPQTSEQLAGKAKDGGGNLLDVKAFQTGLFYAEPTGVIHRMVDSKEVRVMILPAVRW